MVHGGEQGEKLKMKQIVNLGDQKNANIINYNQEQ